MATLALIAVARRVHGVHPMPERSPLELADEAQSILTEFLGAAPAAAPFEVYSYAQEVPVYVRSGFRLVDRLSGNPVEHHFWYRTSDEPISPREATSQLFGFGRVRAFDPVPGAPGTTIVVFDRSGSVVFLDARRPPDASTPLAGPVSWERVFQLAGLRFEEFESCAPLPARAAQADRHLAWESSDASLRVESATSGGSVVAFELLEPEAAGEAPSASSDLFILLNTLLIAGLLAIAMPRALRHFRSGRGDPQISVRVALCTTGALLCSWLLYADYPGTAFDRFAFCIAGVFTSFAGGYLIWILSVAVEPSVQRDWPRIFITWSRFFRGHVRGPGVRSDLLTGLALGLFVVLLQALVGAGVNDAVELSPAVRTFHWSIWAGTAFEAVSASVLISLEFVAVLAILG